MNCPKCGTEQPDGVNFCHNCGNLLDPSKASLINSVNTEAKLPSSQARRFFNYILDQIFYYIFTIAILVIMNLLKINEMAIGLFAIFSLFIYYTLFEGVWARTPAKFITKTRVVTKDGSKPTIGKVIVRSLCRYIPFEPFSLLFNNNPVGWHDSLSSTLVVPINYTEQDIREIKTEKNKPKILLIVILAFAIIFIIGLLSTLAIVALNNARVKSRDARRVSDIMQIRTALELYYGDNEKYPEQLTDLTKYLIAAPQNPRPNDGSCDVNFDYKYQIADDSKSYDLEYCLGENTGNMKAGYITVRPEDVSVIK